MAGIGFELRRLYRQDSLAGLARAYFNSALASSGPWLFTVIALAAITLISDRVIDRPSLDEFRSIIIYNFCFSLVLPSPIFMTATRYVSDAIHKKDVSSVPGVMAGCLLLFLAIALPLNLIFYFGVAKLSLQVAALAAMNFMLTGILWITTTFLSALKDYRTITRAFLGGMLVAMLAACALSGKFGAAGLLTGFNAGLSIIVAMIVARIFAEYPYRFKTPFDFLPYFRKYWEIALGGLVYNSATWVDKWIMWLSPNATRLPDGLVTYPNYDSAMFLAFLSIIPAMAMFLFNIETHFFEHYLRFYRDIQRKATFSKIERNHRGMMESIRDNALHIFLLQLTLCLVAIMAAPRIMTYLHGNFLQIGIFRFGLLGALFHVMLLFLLILLSYLDSHRKALFIAIFFFLTNAIFTLITLKLGFIFYGYGYFLSSFLTFLCASIVTLQHIRVLPYHSFITSNASLA